jgi:cytoskeletal protein CcmA (bactofilin family)
MRTNHSLFIEGNRVRVQGYGFYAGASATASPPRALFGSFNPLNPILGDETVQHVPYMDLPTFDSGAYLAKMGGADQTGVDVVLDGEYHYGTRENPTVVHVTGNLTAYGSTTIHGYVAFIVDGNIIIEGNVEAGDSGYAGGDESSVALYAGGNVELGGTMDIYGQVYANGNLHLYGTPEFYGSLTTHGTATIEGTPRIYYRRASPALTTNWQESESAHNLIAFSEF